MKNDSNSNTNNGLNNRPGNNVKVNSNNSNNIRSENSDLNMNYLNKNTNTVVNTEVKIQNLNSVSKTNSLNMPGGQPNNNYELKRHGSDLQFTGQSNANLENVDNEIESLLMKYNPSQNFGKRSKRDEIAIYENKYFTESNKRDDVNISAQNPQYNQTSSARPTNNNSNVINDIQSKINTINRLNKDISKDITNINKMTTNINTNSNTINININQNNNYMIYPTGRTIINNNTNTTGLNNRSGNITSNVNNINNNSGNYFGNSSNNSNNNFNHTVNISSAQNKKNNSSSNDFSLYSFKNDNKFPQSQREELGNERGNNNSNEEEDIFNLINSNELMEIINQNISAFDEDEDEVVNNQYEIESNSKNNLNNANNNLNNVNYPSGVMSTNKKSASKRRATQIIPADNNVSSSSGSKVLNSQFSNIKTPAKADNTSKEEIKSDMLIKKLLELKERSQLNGLLEKYNLKLCFEDEDTEKNKKESQQAEDSSKGKKYECPICFDFEEKLV